MKKARNKPNSEKEVENGIEQNTAQIPLVDSSKLLGLCIHEKKIDLYQFRCQPSLAKLLREKGPEWVRQTLIQKLERK